MNTKLGILLVWFCAACATGAEFFVAPAGSDTNLGTRAQPFATLTKAREAVRVIAGKEAVTVYLLGGTYLLPQGLKFDAKDGGSREAPVVWRAWKNEKPVLVGGRSITNFVPFKGEILKADAGAQGFKGIYFRQLIFDGRRQPLARYPNFDPQNPYGGGWAYADGKLKPMYADIPGEDKVSFTVKTNDVRSWSRPEEVEVFVFARFNWWNDIIRLASFDATTRKVTLNRNASYPVRPGDRYYFQNALEELDAPGEWYLDKQTSTLYFWPPTPLAGKTVVAPTTREILQLAPGTANVTFRGLTFECAEGTAITLNKTTNCLIAGCIIRNVGDYRGSGVAISGGKGNGVQGCDIFETGSSGISLGGGDVKHLIAAENFADNNYIHHVGVFYKQGVGISLDGVGNRASHNLIHDGPRMGIMFHGNNLVIEYNEIRHMNLETEDTGAVYTGGRDWLGSRGTVIRYNYFHDMLGFGHDEKGVWHSPHFAWGVYLDDNTGGVDVIGNLVVRCSRAGIHLHNGRDNFIVNNIFVDNGQQQFEYSGWTAGNRMWREHLPTMITGYDSVAGEPAWQTMRNMNLHPTNAVLADGTIMSGNVFCRNLISWKSPDAKLANFRSFSFDHNQSDSNLVWHFNLPLRMTGFPKIAETNQWAEWRARGLDRSTVIADPEFVAPEKDDYRLRPGSPAFRLGFVPIPVEKIGPYADELRASWPIVQAEGAREKPLVLK
jgi:parallel beta-helix repeat protein